MFISNRFDSYQVFYRALKFPDFLQRLVVPFHLIDVHGQVLRREAQKHRESLRHHASTWHAPPPPPETPYLNPLLRSLSITACTQRGTKRPRGSHGEWVSDRALGLLGRMTCVHVGVTSASTCMASRASFSCCLSGRSIEWLTNSCRAENTHVSFGTSVYDTVSFSCAALLA